MSIFNMDGPVFRFLNKMADLCILNLIFLLCCLPIITIGASVTALYSVTLKMSRDQDGYIARSFFKAFKANFKQATSIWIPSLLLLFIMLADIRIYSSSNAGKYQPLLIGAYLIFILITFMLIFAFPVLAKFKNTTGNIIKNAFLMGIGSFQWTLCILVILIVPAVLTLMIPANLSFIYMLWLLFGFALIALCTSYIFDYKIFPKYIKVEPSESSEEDPDSPDITEN